ncbi:MAG: GNAT family N-acetyltransferase [Bacteroidota bacterium]
MEPLSIRKAQESDILVLFEWANEPVTRANSISQSLIQWENHQVWFSRKLQDPNCFLYISEQNAVAVGMLRLEYGNEKATISYSIAKNHRGKGLGKKTLEVGIKQFLGDCQKPISMIEALVKPENIASVKTFEKLGFHRSEDRVIQGVRLWMFEFRV